MEGDEDLFVEENETSLSPRSQEIVSKYIYEFIKKEYTCAAKPDEVKKVCKAAIELFGSLMVKESTIEGIVCFY